MATTSGKGDLQGAVLFDFGGVLAEEGFREGLKEIARRRALDPEEFYQLGAAAVYESGYVTGEGSESDFWEAMCRKSSLVSYEEWFTREILQGFVLRPRMLAVADELRRKGLVVAILSDQTDWLDQLDARDHFFQQFDRIFNSYYLGKGKRDPSLFDDVVRTLDISAPKVLFVDDNEGHVERARSRGLKAMLFRDEKTFLSELTATLRFNSPSHAGSHEEDI
ncbi:MAG TPA: HAD family phosphatase [Desulfuromonadales bacterium]|nr:HAD family phosphatase [Desulfuromonadales bacterium]